MEVSLGQELENRWSVFLIKIEAAFDEGLVDGRSAVMEQIREGFDYISTCRSLDSIAEQMTESLLDRIDSDWRTIVEPEFIKAKVNFYSAYRKGFETRERLFQALQEWLICSKGEIAIETYRHVIDKLKKQEVCNSCSAPLPIIKILSLSQRVQCSYCGVLNTLIPAQNQALIEHIIVDDIVKYKLLDMLEGLMANHYQPDIGEKTHRFVEAYIQEKKKWIFFDEKLEREKLLNRYSKINFKKESVS